MFVNALCLEDIASLVSLVLSDSYNLPASSSVEITGPQSEGFNEDITFRSECSKSTFQLWVSVFVPISRRKKLL